MAGKRLYGQAARYSCYRQNSKHHTQGLNMRRTKKSKPPIKKLLPGYNPKADSFRGLFKDRQFRRHLLAFVVFNVVLYLGIFLWHGQLPLNIQNYLHSSHHHYTDARIHNPESFDFLRALGQYDAQFYLKIADDGYASDPSGESQDKTDMGKLAYAFSPAYPLLIAGVKPIFQSVELSAFIVTQFTLLLGFTSVYWLVARWFSAGLAIKTAWLVFVYPFSIFYRSYFSEGLFLILLAILLNALLANKKVVGAIAAGWLIITRFIGVAASIVYIYWLIGQHRKKEVSLRTTLGLIAVVFLPIFGYMLLNYFNTGDPLYFISVRSSWIMDLAPPLATFSAAANFLSSPLHFFHSSQIDVLSIVVAGALLYFSRGWLPRTWWQVAFLIWLIPILTTDTMSASRYQIINLPLFIYAAHILTSKYYRGLATMSAIGLFIVSIYFINWYWVG